jgi:hypothetical protein
MNLYFRIKLFDLLYIFLDKMVDATPTFNRYIIDHAHFFHDNSTIIISSLSPNQLCLTKGNTVMVNGENNRTTLCRIKFHICCWK